MIKKLRLGLILMLCLAMIAGIAACGNGDGGGTPATPAPPDTPPATPEPAQPATPADPAPGDDVIVIEYYTYIAGTHGNAAVHAEMIGRFNALNEGVYRMDIIHIPQDDWDDFIKQRALINELPTLVNHMHDVEWQLDFVAPNQLSYDLRPWLTENPHIMNLFLPVSVDFVRQDDGRIPFLPKFVSNPVGLFYNSDVWTPSMPTRDMTWDQFVAEIGTDKLTFMTGENAWMTQLLFTAAIANSPGGVNWLNSHIGSRVTDYNNPAFIEGARKLQQLLMHNSIPETMLGATFAEAANSFYNNDTIMIFNGPWMFGSFREETGADNWGPDFHGRTVVADLFPGNFALELPAEIGLYWVAANAGDDQIRAALAYLEFFLSDDEMQRHLIQSGGMSPGFTPTPGFWAAVEEDQILQHYMEALATGPTVVPRLDQITFDSIAQPEMPNLLPMLANGSMTPEEFAQALTDLAAEIVAAGGF